MPPEMSEEDYAVVAERRFMELLEKTARPVLDRYITELAAFDKPKRSAPAQRSDVPAPESSNPPRGGRYNALEYVLGRAR